MSAERIQDAVLLGPDLNRSRTPLDKKHYRQIIIKQNGLKVVLVSDTMAMIHQEHYEEESESEEDEQSDVSKDQSDSSSFDDEDDGIRKAAAALIVGAGSYHDPPYAQGLAHFLEHMLFMGTEKYKGENQFDAFLSKHSGSDNAYTELEHTMYHMEIAQDKFFEALDMFAQFFISPLMLQDSVERELKSIESEFKLSQNSDECRLQQLLCHDVFLQQANGGKYHPFAKFSWGNIESLKHIPEKNGIDMMKELRTFFNRHYFAHNMSLVVIGAFSLDELEKQVVESFSGVPSMPRIETDADGRHDFYDQMSIKIVDPGTWSMKAHTAIHDFGMPFDQQSLGRICRIIPVKDKHSLNITWQLPPQWSNWKSKPCDYISHLLGHEARGSLLSALKERSWANECFAGVGSGGYENASSHALFTMNFSLSQEGVFHWVEIVDYVYKYIGMIRFYCTTEGLPSWIYDELRAIQEVSHKYEDEATPIDLVETLADCLVPYKILPPERLLDGDALLFEFDSKVIQSILDYYLTPINARIDLTSSSFGRAANFDDHFSTLGSSLEELSMNSNLGDACVFDRETSGDPLVEPIFGTHYWSHVIPKNCIQQWEASREPCFPDATTGLSLPPVNPFVPTKFDLKSVPSDDSHHPLLFTCLKICITVAKKKVWFPCTVSKFNSIKNEVLLTFEDGDEKWHKLDIEFHDQQIISPDFHDTFDNKTIKFRVIAVPKDGEGAVMKYGDESDLNVEDGFHFPHVPPRLPQSRLPKLLFNSQKIKMWHLQDRKFKRPIAELRLQILCSGANESPLRRACADLLTIILHDVTTETSYMANVCELCCEIQSNDVGFGIRIHGFDHKILTLLAELLSVLVKFKTNNSNSKLPPSSVKTHRYQACLEVLRRNYINAGIKASKLCSDVRLRCIRSTNWSSHSKHQSISDLTISTFMNTISNVMDQVQIEALFHGNVSPSDAYDAKELISSFFVNISGISKQYPHQNVIVAPCGNDNRLFFPTVDIKDPNTAVEVYFQCGSDNIIDRVVVDILMQMMYEPLYDTLRTKEQFGYSVSCSSRWSFGVIGMSFRVTTTCKSAYEVCERIDSFLVEYKHEIQRMTKDVFMEHVIGLAKNKLEKCDSLADETGNIWYEIVEMRYDFEAHRNEAECLRSLTKQQVIDGFDRWLNPDNPARRKIEVCAIGLSEGSASIGRPNIDPENVNEFIDEQVAEFHRKANWTTY